MTSSIRLDGKPVMPVTCHPRHQRRLSDSEPHTVTGLLA
jgi:hypothetical protein